MTMMTVSRQEVLSPYFEKPTVLRLRTRSSINDLDTSTLITSLQGNITGLQDVKTLRSLDVLNS